MTEVGHHEGGVDRHWQTGVFAPFALTLDSFFWTHQFDILMAWLGEVDRMALDRLSLVPVCHSQ